MPKFEPRWGKVLGKTIEGMERFLANQRVMEFQARATVAALEEMKKEMKKEEGEEDKVFEMRVQRMDDTINQAQTDLELKEKVAKFMTENYANTMNEVEPEFEEAGTK